MATTLPAMKSFASQEAEINDKIKRLFRQPEAVYLRARLEERLKRCYESLRTRSEPIEIGRSQGNIEILEWVLKLKED